MSITQTAGKKVNNPEVLNVKFTEKPISGKVTYTYIENFKEAFGYKSLLEDHLLEYDKLRGANRTYSVSDIIEFMTDAVIMGNTRFMHMDEIRSDTAYQLIHGKAPSEKVCRDLLKQLPAEAADALRAVNKDMLAKQASMSEVREVCADFDDTVVTVFGKQEKSNKGYNPKYKGKPSYKEKVGMISGTKELLDATLEEGSHHSNYEFLEYFKRCEATIPKEFILKRVRLDSGFFDQDLLSHFEHQEYEYVVKAKMYKTVFQIVEYVSSHPDEYKWQEVKEETNFHTTDIFVPLPNWDKARRFIIGRKTIANDTAGEQLMMDEFRYEYHVIVTNIDYMNSAEIFREYNQRCTVETDIDELKDGFAFSENSQLNHKCNELFMLIKMIAYNLHNWFKQAILPEDMHKHRIGTLRRIFYNVSGIIAGNGWYRHILVQSGTMLEQVIDHIRSSLQRFMAQAAAG